VGYDLDSEIPKSFRILEESASEILFPLLEEEEEGDSEEDEDDDDDKTPEVERPRTRR